MKSRLYMILVVITLCGTAMAQIKPTLNPDIFDSCGSGAHVVFFTERLNEEQSVMLSENVNHSNIP